MNPPNALGVASTPVPLMAGLLDGLFMGPSNLKDVAAKILISNNLGELALDRSRIDHDLFLGEIRSLK